jgi:hypothetical protein
MQNETLSSPPGNLSSKQSDSKRAKKPVLEQYSLLFIYIAFSVSVIEFFLLKQVLFIITSLLGLIVFFRYRKFDKIVYQIILYMVLVQFLAMWRFEELTLDRFVSLGLAIVRFFLGFFIIKLGGKDFLKKFEKISFAFIIIGLFLFFLDHSLPQVSKFLRNVDFNSIQEQSIYGGWNIFVYVHSGWAGFRFCGYAWEPGGMAMMITLSWIFYILNYGTALNLKVLIYFIAMVFTFSTTGYFVLGIFSIFYIVNRKAFSFIIMGIPLIIFLVLITPYIWKQDFMQKKLNGYIERDQEVRSYSGGYSRLEGGKNTGRIGALFVGFDNISKWPLGHGTVKGGRTKNESGEIVSGANGLMEFLVLWGVVGVGYLTYSLYLFIYYRHNNLRIKHKYLLLLCILLVFSSNQISYSPVMYTLLLFPHLFRRVNFSIPKGPVIFRNKLTSSRVIG